MNKEFARHRTIKIYEASRDGVARHGRLKKPVGTVSNAGYLMFTAGGGGKLYLKHRFVYECYFGEIKKGFVVDHFDENIKNNSINNLRVVSQSENCSSGNTDRCKTVIKELLNL